MTQVTMEGRPVSPAFDLGDLWPAVSHLAERIGGKLTEFDAAPGSDNIGAAMRAEYAAEEAEMVARLLRVYAAALRSAHQSSEFRFLGNRPAGIDPFTFGKADRTASA